MYDPAVSFTSGTLLEHPARDSASEAEYNAWWRMRLPLCLITARENSSEHTARPANHHSHIIYHTIPPSVCLSNDHHSLFLSASFQAFTSVTLLPHARLDSKHHQLLNMQQGSLTFQSPIRSMILGSMQVSVLINGDLRFSSTCAAFWTRPGVTSPRTTSELLL